MEIGIWLLIGIALIISIQAVLVSYLTLKTNRENKAAIQEVHDGMNSRMDELLEAAKAVATAEGREIGRAERK